MDEKYPSNKSKEFFRKIIFICYLSGLPNFWIEDIKLPKSLTKCYDAFCKYFNKFMFLFVFLQLLSLFTQHNLSEKEQNFQLIFCVAHPFVVTFPTLMARHKERLRGVLLDLLVTLKQIHNDPDAEKRMIKQVKYYSIALSAPFWISMVSYCSDTLMQVIKTGSTFNIIIMVWPLVEDKSVIAAVARFFYHVTWVMFETRVTAAYIIVISVTTCISYQYKNLQRYFESLNQIFKEDLSQNEKERKYEEMLKIGIQAHSDTLRVTKASVTVCRGVLSAQVIFNIFFLVILLYQSIVQTEDRSLTKMFSNLCTVITLLFSTWFFTCNAGDVSYEASFIGTAIYSSGWHNCYGVSSIRIRKLLVIAMSCAQRPVIIKGVGILTLTHQAFLTIVKFSYSVFSLLY